MLYEYTGDSKKDNIEKFVVRALGDIFNDTDVFEENPKMNSALNFLYAVRNKINVVEGMTISSHIKVENGKLVTGLSYGGKKFDPQCVTKGERGFSNRGHYHIKKALNWTALSQYKYSYSNGSNIIEAIFDLSNEEFEPYKKTTIEGVCRYNSAIVDEESITTVHNWVALSFIHLGMYTLNSTEKYLKDLGKTKIGFSPVPYDGTVYTFLKELIFNIYHHSYVKEDEQFKFRIYIYEEIVKISVEAPISLRLDRAFYENTNTKEGTREIVHIIQKDE